MPDYEFVVRVQAPDDAHAEAMADALMDAAIDEASEQNAAYSGAAGDVETIATSVRWKECTPRPSGEAARDASAGGSDA